MPQPEPSALARSRGVKDGARAHERALDESDSWPCASYSKRWLVVVVGRTQRSGQKALHEPTRRLARGSQNYTSLSIEVSDFLASSQTIFFWNDQQFSVQFFRALSRTTVKIEKIRPRRWNVLPKNAQTNVSNILMKNVQNTLIDDMPLNVCIWTLDTCRRA